MTKAIAQPWDAESEETPARALAELAHRVRRLAPSHRDPHRFHEEKSEIEHALVLMVRRFGDG